MAQKDFRLGIPATLLPPSALIGAARSTARSTRRAGQAIWRNKAKIGKRVAGIPSLKSPTHGAFVALGAAEGANLAQQMGMNPAAGAVIGGIGTHFGYSYIGEGIQAVGKGTKWAAEKTGAAELGRTLEYGAGEYKAVAKAGTKSFGRYAMEKLPKKLAQKIVTHGTKVAAEGTAKAVGTATIGSIASVSFGLMAAGHTGRELGKLRVEHHMANLPQPNYDTPESRAIDQREAEARSYVSDPRDASLYGRTDRFNPQYDQDIPQPINRRNRRLGSRARARLQQ